MTEDEVSLKGSQCIPGAFNEAWYMRRQRITKLSAWYSGEICLNLEIMSYKGQCNDIYPSSKFDLVYSIIKTLSKNSSLDITLN